jgi:eukaryotic-like serine/threonine-protein kinase
MASIPVPKGRKDRGSSGVIPVVGKRYRPGQTIADKYQLVRKLGEGGMGEVWVGHNSVLDVHCAIKLLELEPTDESRALTQRLLDEARAAARIGHAAIVRVHDFGETRYGDPFFAMELLEGEDLASVLERERKLDPVRAVQLLLPIAHALASAHAQGIVHRDVKPENIFLAKDPVTTLQPKLLDFGVMRMVDRPRKLTVEGVVVGTPDYMSPEQARGANTTGLTDLWSFCVVLYEVLAGRRPLDGDNYNALMRSIIEDEPKTLAELGFADQELSQIVQRGMQKDPEQRWTTMRELGEELALWLEGQNVYDDVTGNSLRRAWLSATESQKIDLPPDVLRALDAAPPSGRSGRVPSGSGARPLPRADASGPHRAPTISGAHGTQTSEPELQAIADLNEGGDPETMLVRATRKKNLAAIVFVLVLVLMLVLAVLVGTGIMIPGPDAQ